jgi:NitT/TauT family transport system permease protein
MGSVAARPVRLRLGRRGRAAGRATLLGLAGVVAFFAAWEAASRLGIVEPIFISRPSLVAIYIWRGLSEGTLWEHIGASLTEFGVAYSMAAVAGVGAGFAVGYYRRVREAVEGFLWFFYASPLVVFYPLLMMWLGLGTRTVVAIAFLIALFPIILNTAFAVRSVDPVLIRCARSYCATDWAIFWKIIVPGSIPLIAAGLRLAVGPAMVGVILGELFGADRGLGYLVADHGRRLQTTPMMGAILLATTFSMVCTTLLGALPRREA